MKTLGFHTRPVTWRLAAVVLTSALTAACLHQPEGDNALARAAPLKAAMASPDEPANDLVADARHDLEFHALSEISELSDYSLWSRVVDGFQLETDLNQQRLQAEMDWFSRHPNYMERVMQRAEPFMYYILEEAEKRDLPTELVLLPIVESAFQPFAYSHGRAAGIWQFIPSTGKLYGLEQNWWYDGRRDIYASTQAALQYLENLNKMFDGNWLHALAAYNSGPGNVRKAIRKNKKRGKPTDFWNLRLPLETRTYVPRLLALKEVVLIPYLYNASLRCIPQSPGFRMVDAGSQIDLALAAEIADIDLDTLYRYNPGYNRWSTPPSGPHTFLLPAEAADTFEQNIASVPEDQRVQWQRHKIKEGETLSHIAARYSTTVKELRNINKLRGNNIRAGKHLLIPVASRSKGSYALSASQRLKKTKSTPRGKNRTRIEHTVQAGDSFWEIARDYKVGMHQLAKWNGMAVRDKLRVGQTLVIWTGKESVASKSSARPATIQRLTHTVRNGDSLSRIASRYRVTVADLQRWNTIKGKYLQPGQKIRVFVDVTRQTSGST